MNYRSLLLALVAGAAAMAITSCSAANSLGQYASRMGSAVTRSIR
jgi:hypothetical protein